MLFNIKLLSCLNKSIFLDSPQNVKLQDIVDVCGDEMSNILGKDSPAGLLWEQQKESTLKGKQIRWHPAIIRWCITLHSKSSSGYNILRHTLALFILTLILPTQPQASTLQCYTE